jgi:hypothetical protein
MMLTLLVYNYAVGRMSSRQIAKAMHEDVASRYICGGEVQELMALAEQADREAVPETLKVPEEIARREARQRKLEEARRVIEARHKAKMAEKQREFAEKAVERAARRERGEPVRGPEPQPPPAEPEAKEQYNFTDPEMGFRRFLLRGLRKVNLEWSLVRLAYNFRRLAKLLAARQGTNCAPMTPRTA